MVTAELNYELEGVPSDLAEQVRNSANVLGYLQNERATGLRLVRLKGGWSSPRTQEKVDEAYEVQILGRPGREDNTRIGSFGQCYIKIDGEWWLTQLAQC